MSTDMSTDSDHGADAGVDDEDPHHVHSEGQPHKPDSYYIKIALVLAVITALETSTYWVDFGPFFMPLLLTLMVIKFLMVVMYFMHLKQDSSIFGMLFYSGLILAIVVYAVTLLTFSFFG